VTLNRSAEKLLVGSYGVAFSKFPSSSLLTRTVAVYDTDYTTTIPWTATSDSSWLTVTTGGTTSTNAATGNLVLTANPAGLAVDQEYVATVTVSTSNGLISNQEKIRVGLWVGSADPVTVSFAPPAPSDLRNVPAIAMDPVEPYAFLSEGDSSILVYNVYTGALVTTYTNVGTSLGALAVSDDGSTLYVEDVPAGTVVPVNVENGAVGTPYNLHTQLTNGEALAYGKVSDEPFLVSASGIGIDLTTGQLTLPIQGVVSTVAISPDGYAVTAMDSGGFPSTLFSFRASYSSLTGNFNLTQTARGSSGMSSGADLAFAMDGSGNDLILAGNGAVNGIEEAPWTGGPWTVFPMPGAPGSLSVGWNGVIAAGIGYSDGTISDIYVFSASGTLLGSMYAPANPNPAGSSLTGRTVRLSGDATRMSAITYSSGYVLNFLSVP
jgi:hypothetical protein